MPDMKIVLTDEQRTNIKEGLRAGREIPGNKINFVDDFNMESKNWLKKTFGDAGVLITFGEIPEPEPLAQLDQGLADNP